MTSKEQAAKTIEQLIAEIGLSHRPSKISGLRVLITETSVGAVAVDEMDAHDAALFHLHALSAA